MLAAELAELLKGYGFDVTRGGSMSFGDVPDLVGLPGVHYEARKNTSAFKGNQYTGQSGAGQNVQIVSRREQQDGTAGQIGKEVGVDGRTVRRAEHFAKGIDRVAKMATTKKSVEPFKSSPKNRA